MNTRTFFSALIFSASSTFAFASSNESSVAVVAGENANVFKVVYKSAGTSRVLVSILDANHEIVFSESFNKMNGFTRPYNFNGLPEGEYTIEVKDNQGKKVEKVNYRLGSIKSLIKVVKIKESEAKYMLTVANRGTNSITIAILNEDGDQLFKDTHAVEGDFGIIYNLVKTGTYTFIVTDKLGNTELFMD